MPNTLEQRILSTLKFFDLQGLPLTLFEIHKYLLADTTALNENLDSQWEIIAPESLRPAEPVSLADVQHSLDGMADKEIKYFRGHYYLPRRDESFVLARLHNYLYGIKREYLIRRYSLGLRFVPFVRGAGLVGSQAFGLHKAGSDIDLLVIVEPDFLWLARLFTTAYFQVLGIRRHGSHVKNRFCLNHYLAGPKPLTTDRNLYTASEYVKMRPLYPSAVLDRFRQNNLSWLKLFFPNIAEPEAAKAIQPGLQRFLEKLFQNKLGRSLESLCRRLQKERIDIQEFIVVEEDELSFHPDNRKEQLFSAFFKGQE